MSLREELLHAVDMIEQKGREYAEAKSLSWHLQEMRKVVLAKETSSAKGSSVSERESWARQSPKYLLHIDGTKDAIKKEFIAKAENERWFAQYEALRSLISYEKNQIKTFQE